MGDAHEQGGEGSTVRLAPARRPCVCARTRLWCQGSLSRCAQCKGNGLMRGTGLLRPGARRCPSGSSPRRCMRGFLSKGGGWLVWLFVLWSIGLSPKASGIYTPTTPRTPRPSAGAGAAAAAGRDPLTGEYRTVQEVPVPAKSRETSEPLTADTDDTGVKARSLTTRISYEGMLVTFGGHNGEEFLSSVESWVPGSKGWKGEADMLQPRAHFASCIYNGRIWAMGGWDPYNKERMQADATEAKALDSVEIFQPRLGSWSLGPRMVSARAFHGAHTVGGSIYLVGGFDGTRDLDLVDRLEVARGTWIRGRPLKHARSGCVCGSVRGRLFVMGGHNGLQGLGTCESLDPREGRWRQEPDMLYHRAYPAATSAGDCIFVGGGNFGISYLDTVEMYDARKGAWRMLPSLNIKRNGASLALVGDALYAVGGFDGESECLSVTEKLDLSKPISSQPWQVMAETLARRDGSCTQAVTTMTPQWRGVELYEASESEEPRGVS